MTHIFVDLVDEVSSLFIQDKVVEYETEILKKQYLRPLS